MAMLSLEKLIDSLTKGELRAFTLSVKKNKDAIYYEYFNRIRKGEPLARKDNNVLQVRKYLYDSILTVLVNQSNDIDNTIQKYLMRSEVLLKKRLIKEAWREIVKAQKIAERYERFGFLIQILEVKKRIGFHKDDFSHYDYNELWAFEERIVKQHAGFLRARSLYNEILELKKKSGYLKYGQSIEKERIEWGIVPSDTPKRTMYYILMAQALFHWLKKEHLLEYEITKDIIDRFEPHLEGREKLQANLEHLTSCICTAKFSELLMVLKNIKELVANGTLGASVDLELRVFYYASNYEIMTYSYMGENEKLELKLAEVEEGVEKWKRAISTEMWLVLCSALKSGYFFIGNYKKSRKYINFILNQDRSNVRKDVYEDALFFNILLIYDRGDYDYLESTVKHALRYCEANFSSDSFEYQMVLFFEVYLNDWDSKKLYKELLRILLQDALRKVNGRMYSENYLPHYFWVKSKIENKKLVEIVLKWNL